MLDAEYGIYSDGQSHIVRTQAYSLPKMLHEHIDLVSPTIYFGRAGRPLADTIANGKNDYLNNDGKTAIPAFPYETKGEIAYNGLCNSTNVTLACMARHYGYEGYGRSISFKIIAGSAHIMLCRIESRRKELLRYYRILGRA